MSSTYPSFFFTAPGLYPVWGMWEGCKWLEFKKFRINLSIPALPRKDLAILIFLIKVSFDNILRGNRNKNSTSIPLPFLRIPGSLPCYFHRLLQLFQVNLEVWMGNGVIELGIVLFSWFTVVKICSPRWREVACVCRCMMYICYMVLTQCQWVSLACK